MMMMMMIHGRHNISVSVDHLLCLLLCIMTWGTLSREWSLLYLWLLYANRRVQNWICIVPFVLLATKRYSKCVIEVECELAAGWREARTEWVSERSSQSELPFAVRYLAVPSSYAAAAAAADISTLAPRSKPGRRSDADTRASYSDWFLPFGPVSHTLGLMLVYI